MKKWEMKVVREIIIGKRSILARNLKEVERIENLLLEAGIWNVTKIDASKELGVSYAVWISTTC